MKIRALVFWMHLSAGVVAGSVVLLMSVTGLLLTYERQIETWVDGSLRRTDVPEKAVPLPIESLLARVRAASPDVEPTSVTVRPDPAEPAVLGLGRGKSLFVDRYTAALLGEGSPRLRTFFRGVTNWHRWLGRSGEGRATARAVTGACNLAFLLLVTSGLYLWWPRSWRIQTLRSLLWFRPGLRGKAKDFNWHNVIGFWSAMPLLVIVSSGVVISYPWASGLVYRLAGSDPPARRGPGDVRGRASFSKEEPPPELLWLGLDDLLPVAEARTPGWRSLTVRRPDTPHSPMVFLIDRGSGGEPRKRSTLTLDRRTCEVLGHETFADQTPGRRLRSWLRFAHTGEVYGVLGQTVAGLASAGAAFLVWTGLALAWRRLFPSSHSSS